jgi:hypothetical protein
MFGCLQELDADSVDDPEIGAARELKAMRHPQMSVAILPAFQGGLLVFSLCYYHFAGTFWEYVLRPIRSACSFSPNFRSVPGSGRRMRFSDFVNSGNSRSGRALS